MKNKLIQLILPNLLFPCLYLIYRRSLCYILISVMFFSCKQAEVTMDNLPPEENRFTKVVLTEGLDEPMEIASLNDGRFLIVERKGGVKLFDTKTNLLKKLSTILVNTKYTSKEGVESQAEEGLMGVIAHPDFARNHWIYLYYADPIEKKHILARWELLGDSLYPSSKKVLLEVNTQREICCHTGGGMVFDKQGNLFLTVGNNTANPVNGTSSQDERPGRESWDDQRSSGNSNDLRGKILRIHPEDKGGYSIPEGNLFRKGMAKTRPEIYIMGDRNPWRVSIDSKTGYLYWGEVGPDASVDSVYGSRGYDEFNQARKPGYFGWPYFIADNKSYVKYNYADSSYQQKFDPEHPVNYSPNNTGIKELPAPQKAFIWYPYATSDSFPLVGSSGRSATGGPVYHKDDFNDAKRPWPGYFEGKWLITDFMRGWIMAITMDKEGNYKAMERILPNLQVSSAIDMKFGPEGDLYVLEYGSAWFTGNPNSALVRIEYNAGNRKPVAAASANRLAGAVPLTINLSSKGTIDYDQYDKNALQYEWKITGNKFNKTYTETNPVIILDKPGTYQAELTVTDTKGEKNSKSLELKAGNEPPKVTVNILEGNKTFFFPGEQIKYAIDVSDKEDGTVSGGEIKPGSVAVNFDYVPESFDPIEIAQHHRAADERTGFSAALYYMNASDCKSCHSIDKKSVGPGFNEVARKYKNDPTALSRLASKVINGGGGVWGEHAMSAHPNLSQKDAETMVDYILHLNSKSPVKELPLKGSFVANVPPGQSGKGGYLLRAAYSDRGAAGVPSLSAENFVALRNAVMEAGKADEKKGAQLQTTPLVKVSLVGNNSYLGFDNIDLTGIKKLGFLVHVAPNSGAIGGDIEIHLDAPDGRLIGKTGMILPRNINMVRAREEDEKKMRNILRPKPAKQGVPVPASSAGFNPEKLKMLITRQEQAIINPVDGVHKVFFVFKNNSASANQILIHLFEIQFRQN